MTINQLQKVMIFHLNNFNDENIEITNDTIHNEVLDDSDAPGMSNSKQVYKLMIRWTLDKNGEEDKNWPVNWIELSVKDLSEKLLNE